MTPYAFGATEGKSVAQLSGKLNDAVLDYGTYLANGYHYGSRVEVANEYKWFSPDMKTPIFPVGKRDGEYIVSNAAVVLRFGKETTNGWYLVRRQK